MSAFFRSHAPSSPSSLSRRHALLTIAGLAAAPLLHAQPVISAQAPLSIVVGYPPGGSTDRAARLLAEALASKLNTSVVVENKPGAGGRLAAQQFKNTPANRQALMLANPAVMSVAPLLLDDVGYNPATDFQPVSQLTSYDFCLATSPDMPIHTLQQARDWLANNPAKANIGVPASGSLPHFAALMLREQLGQKLEIISYNGSAPLLADLLGGQVPLIVDTEDALIAQHLAKKIRIIASSGNNRSTYTPEAPTFREAGLDFSATGWNTLFASAHMPQATVQALAAAIHQVMQDEAVRKRFAEANITPIGATLEETHSALKAFDAQWAPVVKASGYQP